MAKYVAGIDAGTTGLKTIIFNLNGKELGKAYDMYGIFKNAFLAWRDTNIFHRLKEACEKYYN